MRRLLAASLGLVIALLGNPTRAEETRIIDRTPSDPSICQITPNDRIVYGKILQVINPAGKPEAVVFDQHYNDAFSSLFSGKQTDHLNFSVWFPRGILFTTYWKPQGSDRWILPSQRQETFSIKINDRTYPLSEVDVPNFCAYGNDRISWSKGLGLSPAPTGLKFSGEAIDALKNAQSTDKVSIVRQHDQGNKTFESITPIGSGTISAWKQI